jgi:hypothetical protein
VLLPLRAFGHGRTGKFVDRATSAPPWTCYLRKPNISAAIVELEFDALDGADILAAAVDEILDGHFCEARPFRPLRHAVAPIMKGQRSG